MEDRVLQQKPCDDVDCSSSSANEGNWRSSKKGKEEEDETEYRDDSSTLKKARIVWSEAVPKKILEIMNVPGLTGENVVSHVQKYCLYLRRLSGQHQNGLGNSLCHSRMQLLAQ